MRKSTAIVILGMWLSHTALAGEESGDLRGSCAFQGVYASGCIEFFDGSWDDGAMTQYCQEKSRSGATVTVTKDACNRGDYNVRCATLKDDGSLANMYVNDMPAFICKKYQHGTLEKRPSGGW